MDMLATDVDEFGLEELAGRLEAPDVAADERWSQIARQAVAELFGGPAERAFAVEYWNGVVEPGGATNHGSFGLILNRPGALRRMFLPPTELGIGDAFISGDFDVVGDLERAASLRVLIRDRLRSPRRIARLLRLLRRLPADGDRSVTQNGFRPSWRVLGRRHARERDAEAIRFHYDVSNDFYALWLDEQRVYSCAYFATDHDDLDRAQTAKLEYICRKLRLQSGERLLDIGCGWGGLVRHAVRHYGVDAVGITLSPSQAEYARERITRDGLRTRCTIEVRDYRDIPYDEPFDKVVSVGMFEHVGRRQLPGYFRAAYRLTRPGGIFLNHGIVSLGGARERSLAEWLTAMVWRPGRFIHRYVFPDSELVPLAHVVSCSEAAGWETRDIESLREHYASTLRHWVRRLEASEDSAVAAVGRTTFRIWRLNMGVSAHAFSTGAIGVVQMLLSRPNTDGSCSLPRTRADLYHEAL